MYIIVNELFTDPIEQEFTTINGMEVSAIRLYLYKELLPSGSLVLSLKQGSTVLYTETKAISDIVSESNLMTPTNYFHGFTTWVFTSPIRLERETTYKIVLEGDGGYSSGIGWVKEFENLTNNMTVAVTDFLTYPHSIQIWTKKDMGMIRVLDFTDGFTSATTPAGALAVSDSLEVSFDGFVYHRQTTGVNTAGDWRVSTVAGVYKIEEYSGSAWVEKSAVVQ